MRSDLPTLISALRSLAVDIESQDGIANAVCAEAAERLEEMAFAIDAERRSAAAWRAACRLLYEVIGEGGANGRPMDLISKGDYGRIIAMIGKAEAMETDE